MAEGPSPPPGPPARQGETPAFQGHPEEFLFGGVRENQRGLKKMAAACAAWWEVSWFPGELVSKRKNNFKEIKKKKKKGKLN